MPDENKEAAEKLKKLGARLRLVWSQKHPVSPKTRRTVEDALNEQWAKREITRHVNKPTPTSDKGSPSQQHGGKTQAQKKTDKSKDQDQEHGH